MRSKDVKRRLRRGFGDVEREIETMINEYLRGKMRLDDYLDRRAELESKKWERALENLRKMRLKD